MVLKQELININEIVLDYGLSNLDKENFTTFTNISYYSVLKNIFNFENVWWNFYLQGLFVVTTEKMIVI